MPSGIVEFALAQGKSGALAAALADKDAHGAVASMLQTMASSEIDCLMLVLKSLERGEGDQVEADIHVRAVKAVAQLSPTDRADLLDVLTKPGSDQNFRMYCLLGRTVLDGYAGAVMRHRHQLPAEVVDELLDGSALSYDDDDDEVVLAAALGDPKGGDAVASMLAGVAVQQLDILQCAVSQHGQAEGVRRVVRWAEALAAAPDQTREVLTSVPTGLSRALELLADPETKNAVVNVCASVTDGWARQGLVGALDNNEYRRSILDLASLSDDKFRRDVLVAAGAMNVRHPADWRLFAEARNTVQARTGKQRPAESAASDPQLGAVTSAVDAEDVWQDLGEARDGKAEAAPEATVTLDLTGYPIERIPYLLPVKLGAEHGRRVVAAAPPETLRAESDGT